MGWAVVTESIDLVKNEFAIVCMCAKEINEESMQHARFQTFLQTHIHTMGRDGHKRISITLLTILLRWNSTIFSWRSIQQYYILYICNWHANCRLCNWRCNWISFTPLEKSSCFDYSFIRLFVYSFIESSVNLLAYAVIYFASVVPKLISILNICNQWRLAHKHACILRDRQEFFEKHQLILGTNSNRLANDSRVVNCFLFAHWNA